MTRESFGVIGRASSSWPFTPELTWVKGTKQMTDQLRDTTDAFLQFLALYVNGSLSLRNQQQQERADRAQSPQGFIMGLLREPGQVEWFVDLPTDWTPCVIQVEEFRNSLIENGSQLLKLLDAEGYRDLAKMVHAATKDARRQWIDELQKKADNLDAELSLFLVRDATIQSEAKLSKSHMSFDDVRASEPERSHEEWQIIAMTRLAYGCKNGTIKKLGDLFSKLQEENYPYTRGMLYKMPDLLTLAEELHVYSPDSKDGPMSTGYRKADGSVEARA
jgi:hypothetical protein